MNTDVRYGYNKVRCHQPKYETWEHFISKAGLMKLVLDMGDCGFTEYQFPNAKICDVLQVKKFKELITYQVENKKPTVQEFPNASCMLVDLRKMPDEVAEAFQTIKKYLKGFVV
jgi:hypothetical protein